MSEQVVENINLTPELKKKLKGKTGISINNTFKYVPEVFRTKKENGEWEFSPETWSVFTLRTLSGIEISRLRDQCSSTTIKDGEESTVLQTGLLQTKIIKKGLKGWKRFYNIDFTSEIEFKKDFINKDGELTQTALDFLSVDLSLELYVAITARIELSEEELRSLE